MMASDPQWNNATKRTREGIPVGTGPLNQLRQIAQACAAPGSWVESRRTGTRRLRQVALPSKP